MRKKVRKISKNLMFGVIAILVTGMVIFVFSNPTLAPEMTQPDIPKISPSTNTQSGKTFDDSESKDIIGEGVKAESYLVIDKNTGEVIASRNPKTPLAIASITKLMTAYVVQKYGNLNDIWAVTSSGTLNINPVLGLKVGDRVKIEDLINSILIGSANDAAATLGVYITSLKKVPMEELMNSEAKRLGMTSTHYENPIGFDSEQNYSSASDLLLLINETEKLPIFTKVDRKLQYSFVSENGQSYSVKATNKLLAGDPEIHAIKTGYTDEAKGAMITSVVHEQQNLIIIVLGSSNRENDTKLLKTRALKTLSEPNN